MGVGTFLAVLFGFAACMTVWHRTKLARGHRDVGGFALGLTLTVGLLAATATFVAAPGIWASVYRFVMAVYSGGG